MNAPDRDRRTFLRVAARAGAAAGLAALGTWLVARDKVCLRGGACGRCGLYARCELPQKEKRR